MPDSEGSTGADRFPAAPGTETERRLAHIWADVLQVPRVGVEQNFFDLGGHSLLMHVVHERIIAELDRTPPLIELFRHPTVRSLARYLSEPADSEAPAPMPSRQPTARRTSQLAQRRSQLGRQREQTRGDKNA
ncbi:phosphopantetheine-binding protein [Streptomonospora salina]